MNWADLIRRKKWRIRVDGHRVFVESKPIGGWSDAECKRYLAELGEAVRRTVTPEVWALVTMPNADENPEYGSYVKSVRDELIREYGLNEATDSVEIGLYHMDMLVIGFRAQPGVEYPQYFRGIQLKPVIG